MDIRIIGTSLEAIKKEFRTYIINKNYTVENSSKITWANYQTGISKDGYVKEYCSAIDNQQYSFLMKDGSFFQFFYEFDGSGLKKARLAYFPKPTIFKVDSTDMVPMYEQVERHISGVELLYQYLESGVYLDNSTHYRFDFDRGVTTHEPSHIQFGALNAVRITSAMVLNPFIFMDHVLLNNSEIYQDLMSNGHYISARNYFLSSPTVLAVSPSNKNLFFHFCKI